ncbi:cyclin family protein [Bacillus solimangrovi]|uniref:Uncharacterized protein n=1 Tax=Bacillus solimangrovi TaxID=1305675 RepID=A0A1E5LDJ9_9BACI|nr:SEC-C metal-binding domain-containing protein [Bacillus solimangrovi]OEH92161.1 hypothetical protein BFG57_02505 [Bacillus solimangrovi]
MSKINRNDPCLCGSGKKYKKCCMNGNTVSIEKLVEADVSIAQTELIDYAIKYYDQPMRDKVNELMTDLDVPSSAKDMFTFQAMLWTILHEPTEFGQTVLQEYSEKNASKWKRERVRHIIESWTVSEPVVGEVNNVADNVIALTDCFTGEQRSIRVVAEDRLPQQGNMLIGFMLSFEDSHVFFKDIINITSADSNLVLQHLFHMYKDSGQQSSVEWLRQSYLQTIWESLYRQLDVRPDQKIEWKNEKEESVASLLKEMMNKEELPGDIIEFAIELWAKYCEYKEPKIRNERIYAASLHYLVTQVTKVHTKTQQEFAVLYDLTSSSISTRYREMEKALEEEIEQFHVAVREVEKNLQEEVTTS